MDQNRNSWYGKQIILTARGQQKITTHTVYGRIRHTICYAFKCLLVDWYCSVDIFIWLIVCILICYLISWDFVMCRVTFKSLTHLPPDTLEVPIKNVMDQWFQSVIEIHEEVTIDTKFDCIINFGMKET